MERVSGKEGVCTLDKVLQLIAETGIPLPAIILRSGQFSGGRGGLLTCLGSPYGIFYDKTEAGVLPPLTIGHVLDIWTEKSNDGVKYRRIADPSDFDKF